LIKIHIPTLPDLENGADLLLEDICANTTAVGQQALVHPGEMRKDRRKSTLKS
jgi:hypothetical protein